MTDKVSALAPQVVNYEVEIKYYTTKDEETSTIEAIEGVGGAIEKYNEWQTAALGRDINPDQLRRFILAPSTGSGALRVDVVKPTFVDLSKAQIAKLSGSPIISHEVVAG
jgi:phage-related baseplate assembly protein